MDKQGQETDLPRGQKRSKKTHACQEQGCSKTFSRLEHLRRHQLNHRGDQVWTCQACFAPFVRKDLWRRHWRVRHPGQEPLSDASNSPQDERSQSHSDQNINKDALLQLPSPSRFLPVEEPGVDNSSPRPRTALHAQPSEPAQGLKPQSGPKGSLTLEFSEGHPVMDRSNNRSPGMSIDMNMSWQDWFADVQTVAEPDLGADLSWLFGPLNSEHLPSAIPVLMDHPEIPALQGDHSATSPATLSERDTARQVSLDYIRELHNPTCGFRICCALSSHHRKQLLSMLGTEVADIEPSVLTLPSLRHGIHMFSRFLAKEYPILHHQTFAPSEEHRQLFEEGFELESPPGLMWAVITFGWSILDHRKYGPYRQAAHKIQVNLRRRLIAHPLLKFNSPLWLIQSLFLCLAFARYHGSSEEYGFSTLFHGVLVDVVRRIDPRDQQRMNLGLDVDEDELDRLWFTWIKTQTMLRLIFQTFILDIQHALLHGGDISLSPFSINFQLPESDDAWFAPTRGDWLRLHESLPTRAPEFLSILKSFWNSSTIKPTPSTFPRGCKVLMYGILAIAYDMRRRDDNSFSEKTLYNLELLGSRVRKSFEKWLQWWNQTYNHPQMETVHLWRNCACVFRLGHTLYEVGTCEWRTIAGADTIDGRRIGSADYARAKRKVKSWTKQDRAHVGLAYAATIIQERLSPSHKPRVHCEHCRWCLYIAALICWGFGFVIQGNDTQTHIRNETQIREECDTYLAVATGLRGPCATNVVNKTTGLLLVVMDLIEENNSGEGLVKESLSSLRRLVSPSDWTVTKNSTRDGIK